MAHSCVEALAHHDFCDRSLAVVGIFFIDLEQSDLADSAAHFLSREKIFFFSQFLLSQKWTPESPNLRLGNDKIQFLVYYVHSRDEK